MENAEGLHVAIRSAIDASWTQIEPVDLGQVPRSLRTPDRFVTVESKLGPAFRCDIFAADGECFAFEEACIWREYVAIGYGHHLYLVDLKTRSSSDYELGSYFGQLYPAGDFLLATSSDRIFCIDESGSMQWRSVELGIDGVIINNVKNDVIEGQGEWDPPGGWRPFRVRMQDGQPV